MSPICDTVRWLRADAMKSWVPEAISYQINLRTFACREPRNPIEAATTGEMANSPLDYLTRHLDVLEDLGPTVLHLMPPFPMGQVQRKGIGSPYAVRDYLEVDPEYGSLDELKALVRDAHAAEFKVILGMVPNHTARDHTWVRAQPEFYLRGADGQPLHDADWSDTAKLDYRCPALRRTMTEIYAFWLGLLGTGTDGLAEGVDGFRIDMAHAINDLSFWNELTAALRQRFEGREILLLAECYGIDEAMDLFARGFNGAYDHDFHTFARLLYGRRPDGQSDVVPAPEAAAVAGFGPTYAAFLEGGLAGAAEHVLTGWESRLSDLPTPTVLARYTDNHDEGRGVYRFGDGAVLALNQLIFLSGHAMPFLLAGQEYGAENRPAIHTRFGICDKGMRRLTASGPVEEPGIEFEGNLFARGHRRRLGWRAFYRDLITVRLSAPELTEGDFRLIEPGESCPPNQRHVVGFERRLGDNVVRCAVNLGPGTRRLRHASLFRRAPIYGGMVEDALLPFTAVVVRAG